MSHTCDTRSIKRLNVFINPSSPSFPPPLCNPFPSPTLHPSLSPDNQWSDFSHDRFALLEFYINGNIKVCTLFSGSGFSLLVYLFWDLSVYYVFWYSISFCRWVVLPLHGYTTNLWTLIYQWRLLYHPLCGHTLSVLLDEHLGVEWLGCRIGASLTFQETAKLFSKSGCHSTAITLHICLFI